MYIYKIRSGCQISGTSGNVITPGGKTSCLTSLFSTSYVDFFYLAYAVLIKTLAKEYNDVIIYYFIVCGKRVRKIQTLNIFTLLFINRAFKFIRQTKSSVIYIPLCHLKEIMKSASESRKLYNFGLLLVVPLE